MLYIIQMNVILLTDKNVNTIVKIVKEHKLKGGVLIQCFPGQGLVGRIAGLQLIEYFNAKESAKVFSSYFPHLVVFQGKLGKLIHAELYAIDSTNPPILILTGESQPQEGPQGMFEVLNAILDLAQKWGIETVIAIGNALRGVLDVEVRRVTDLDPKHVKGIDFLVIGSPTRAFHATKNTKNFLKGIAKKEYAQMKVIAFDTRISMEDVDSKILNRMVKTFGYAAEPMGMMMEKRGAKLLVNPIGFYVIDTEGPLKEGEKERAALWAKEAIQEELT